MDANSGEPWSEIYIRDLTNEIAHGRTSPPLVRPGQIAVPSARAPSKAQQARPIDWRRLYPVGARELPPNGAARPLEHPAVNRRGNDTGRPAS
jgi:hypothetical protein